MILQFKEKHYNWGDKFYIYDEAGNKKFRVQNSIVLWNRKWEIMDLDKNVLVTIKQEPRSLVKKKFYIMINDQPVVTIMKELSLIPKFYIEGVSWELKGLMPLEHDMVQGSETVYSLHDEGCRWCSGPTLKIADFVDPIITLGVALTIGYIFNAQEGKGGVDYH